MTVLDQDTESTIKKSKSDISKEIIPNLVKFLTKKDPHFKLESSPIKIEAINVYPNRWRVNVWVWGANNAKVQDSWFVVTDSKGNVTEVR